METQKTSGKCSDLKVSEVKIRLVDKSEDGLIGWASCVINDSLYLNNIAIRYSRDGQVILTFPAKKSRSSLKYFYFNPISREAARVLKEAIIDKLKLLGADIGG
jgi:DNA-binding cell septation regulator SpoVG